MPKFDGFAWSAEAMPEAADPERARVGLERWRSAVAGLADPGLDGLAERLTGEPAARRLLTAVFGNSPFLTFLAEQEPAFTIRLLTCGPEAARAEIMAFVADTARAAAGPVNPSAPLRIAKRRLALATAIADIAGVWPLETVTAALSKFAEAALGCACAHLLADAAARGVMSLRNPDDPQRGSGWIVLGMGKLGARELNYSSDIDIIAFYDPERIVCRERDALQHQFVRLTRGLVRLMAERTAEGYVFRTDLRLRPDPGATPPAISVLAAEAYYETLGQNWERAAMIKARPVAGDVEAGEDFIRRMRPFVWRKNLDFAAIQDIHSIKRQIHAHRGGGAVAIAGHNIKLGRGGIREIEFFAQTQQLIWGGRMPEIRARATVEALRALAAADKIASGVASELIDGYRCLRRIEHRLQMIDDEQTHTLPEDPKKLAALATFLGCPDATTFKAELLARLRGVEAHYAELFEDAPALTAYQGAGGNLVFTGAEPDPETLKTLEALGFKNPRAVDAAVRGWHHGRCRAMRSTRARELLTELMPILLKALADKPDPDAAFLAFDQFLNGLPAGVQLFSMFHANPELLRLVAEIMGVAPRQAEHLARRPSVLEGVLSADFFQPPPPPLDLARELETMLSRARDSEDVLDISRQWANERKFQVAVQSLRGLLDLTAQQEAWSNIAEAALAGLAPHVEADFARAHGRIGGGGMAVIAMGKLGGREMTATSDLDLIFVYASPLDGGASDGHRPLPASQYFARLSQRLINALTAPTAEGQLYPVDMRLRPSGKAGPIATSAQSFERYHLEQAWTWEQMALTRARVVAGPPELVASIERVIRAALTRPRDPTTLVADVADMRARMEKELRAQSLWDVKHLTGGLVDIEFIAQYLQLRHAHAHPEILSPNTATALRAIRDAGLLERPVADELVEALALWQAVQSRLRLTLSDPAAATSGDEAPKALRWALTGLAGLDFDTLVERMRVTAERVHERFRRMVDEPAAEATRAVGE